MDQMTIQEYVQQAIDDNCWLRVDLKSGFGSSDTGLGALAGVTVVESKFGFATIEVAESVSPADFADRFGHMVAGMDVR